MTRITRSQFADYIATTDLKSLFIDMGWNNDTSRYVLFPWPCYSHTKTVSIFFCRSIHIAPAFHKKKIIPGMPK
jgi:hypothetical protein